MPCTRILTFSVFALAIYAGLAWSDPANEAWRPAPLTLEPGEIGVLLNQLVTRFPQLASSPGIKYIEATRGDRECDPVARYKWCGDKVVLIFWPYAEDSGVKLSMLARCARPSATGAWLCSQVVPRHYVQLVGQDFEVRVSDNIDLDTVQALRQAAQPLLATLPREECAAMLTVSVGYDDRMWITWGTAEGLTHHLLTAELTEGADPALAASWVLAVMEPEA